MLQNNNKASEKGSDSQNVSLDTPAQSVIEEGVEEINKKVEEEHN